MLKYSQCIGIGAQYDQTDLNKKKQKNFASANIGLPIISVWDHNITYKLRLYVIKTTKNEIIGSPTLADELAKSLDLRLPQHEMQYNRGPKSPKFEILQTQTHIPKCYKISYSTNTASLNMPEIIGLQTI